MQPLSGLNGGQVRSWGALRPIRSASPDTKHPNQAAEPRSHILCRHKLSPWGPSQKKTAPKCNHFPVNFYPSAPLSPASTHPLPLTSVPWFLEGVGCVCAKCPGSRRAGCSRDRHPTFPRYSRPPAAMLQCRQTIGWGKLAWAAFPLPLSVERVLSDSVCPRVSSLFPHPS